MEHLRRILSVLLAGALCLIGLSALADDRPFTEKWWPTEWGANDHAGAINRINPCTVMESIKLVKKGKTATLGKIYEPGIPAFGARSWRIIIPGKPTGGPFGDGGLVYNDDFVSTEIGQIGTQYDGPGHIGVRTSKGDYYYNGVELQGDGDQYMLDKLGVHNVAAKAYVCRGVLLNAAAYRGMDRLPIPKGGNRTDPGNINDDDIKGIVRKQGLKEIDEGDCVFLYTGHGDIWDDEKWNTFSAEERAKRVAMTNAGEPGIGISGCKYLTARKIALFGGDGWANDAVPSEDPKRPFDCHIEMQTRHGIFNIENMQFRDLLADKAYEFLFVWSPLKIRGGTGSPGNPVAIW
jgi:kynurenine formamidase